MRDTSLDDFIGGDSDDGEDPEDGEDERGGKDADAVGGDAGVDGDDRASTSADDHDRDGDDGHDDGGGHDGADADGAGADAADEFDPGAVEPPVSTYDWTPDGATCAACDVVVDRRWRDGGALVCADCKDW